MLRLPTGVGAGRPAMGGEVRPAGDPGGAATRANSDARARPAGHVVLDLRLRPSARLLRFRTGGGREPANVPATAPRLGAGVHEAPLPGEQFPAARAVRGHG